jgi:F-type H+-transporting ATPase subunit b
MKLRKSMVTALFVCGMLLFVVGARAAEEGAEAASGGSAEIFKWINFAIIAGLIVWFFKSTAVPFFKQNSESISSGITKATAAKAEAERKLQDAEQRLAKLQQEVRGFREEAEREAAAEAERIKALAKFDAEKIGIAAKAEIEAAERSARLELKALAASLAVDGAGSLLAKLTPQSQEALISGFVKSLKGSPN